jgi:hypothetical protein
MPPSAPLLRAPLRVAVRLVAPWAYADGFRLDGIEVREVERYCEWRGRRLHWYYVPDEDLPKALRNDRIDLAIGGLGDAGALRRSAWLTRFPSHGFARGEPHHGQRLNHVWAVSPWAATEWLMASLFLKSKPLREVLSRRHDRGTDAAESRHLQEHLP